MGFDEEYLDDHHGCRQEIERLQSELAEVQDAFNDVVKRLRVQGECEEEIERLQNQLATERGHRQVDNQESRKEIERLRGIAVDLDLAKEDLKEARELFALSNGGEYPLDDSLWAAMKKQRDEAVAENERLQAQRDSPTIQTVAMSASLLRAGEKLMREEKAKQAAVEAAEEKE